MKVDQENELGSSGSVLAGFVLLNRVSAILLQFHSAKCILVLN